MSEMVERVARAICREAAEDSGVVIGDMDRHVDGGWKDWIAEARAAIAAMREPTPDMLFGEPCMSGGKSYMVAVMEIWPKMIEAALNGSKTPPE